MLNIQQAREEEIQEWISTIEYICNSPEIKELLKKLEKEDQAFPQTVLYIEED